jgi:hypothetical protein
VRLELDELIIVREGGRETKITKQRALVKALVAAAINGDMRATNALVSFCAKAFISGQDDQPSAAPEPEDLDILEEFVGRELSGAAARQAEIQAPPNQFQKGNRKMNNMERALRQSFEVFVRKVFRDLHDGETLGQEPYLEYLCHELEQVAKGETRRLVINLPPRHLKTFLGSICLAAWILARKPSTKILVVTYADQLAQHIAYQIRQILQLRWYIKAFGTRIAENRAKVNDFATVQGGGVYAASVGGALTGRGGDIIIFDDPLNIDDANNLDQIERVNRRFDSLGKC